MIKNKNTQYQNNDRAGVWQMPPLEISDTGDVIGALAPAKLNLTLHIGPRRGDGFHDLFSLVVKTDLCDRLTLSPAAAGEIKLTCLPTEPCQQHQNLVYKAAKLLQSTCKTDCGADITLEKQIPDGAGLGGGSADAAVALAGLNRLWNCGLSARQLAELGSQLGSDIPLSFSANCCIMAGRGEKISPASCCEFTAILLCSDIHCPTGEVYAAFDADIPADWQLDTAAVTQRAKQICQQNCATNWDALLVNDLAAPAMKARPALAELKASFAVASGLKTHITGSGSGIYAICRSDGHAEETIAKLPTKIKNCCRIIHNSSW